MCTCSVHLHVNCAPKCPTKTQQWNLLGFLMVLVFVTVLGAGCERRVASARPYQRRGGSLRCHPEGRGRFRVSGYGTLEGYVNAQI